MRKPALAAAACVLIISMSGCGAGVAENSAASSDVPFGSSASTSGTSQVDEGEQPFGERHQFASGLSVSVSQPRSFRPSRSAYPEAERAVAFEITIRNDSERPFQLSEMSVTASVNGTAIREIVDPERGLRGMIGAGEDIAPGRRVRITLAFAVTDDPTSLYLTLQPDPGDPAMAQFIGKA